MYTVKRNKVSKRPPMRHKKLFRKTPNPVILKKLAIALVITVFACFAYVKVYPHTYESKQVEKLQNTVQQLQELEQQQKDLKVKTKQEQQDRDKKIQELNKKLQDTQKQLQSKRAAQKAYAAEIPEPVTSIVANCGDNQYANYIYTHESGCNTSSVNGIGCRGLGQACPGTKLPCGADYACQNAYFTRYANERYGGWYQAYVFWLNNHWW